MRIKLLARRPMLAMPAMLAVSALLTTAACGSPSGSQDLGGGRDQAVATDLSAAGDLAGGGPDLGTTPDAMTGDSQLPPIDSAASLEKWLKDGAYKAWACEKDRHPARPGSAHAANRICSNDLLSKSASGEYPVNSASVKELFDSGGTIIGYAVGVRTKTGPADASWFWYERVNATTYANGPGVALCANCHRNAPRDFIYTQVTP